jgi:methionyl aminopeptidase
MLSDGWTVETKDRRPAAHFEHTVAMTESGPRILTLPGSDEPEAGKVAKS